MHGKTHSIFLELWLIYISHGDFTHPIGDHYWWHLSQKKHIQCRIEELEES